MANEREIQNIVTNANFSKLSSSRVSEREPQPDPRAEGMLYC